jgi:NAD(P) transhydrogenase subunit alpha
MRIGTPREEGPGESRVALTPDGAKALVAKGLEVVIESGAGAAAFFQDADYEAAGAKIGDPWAAGAVVAILPPEDTRAAAVVSRARPESALIAFPNPWANQATLRALCERRITSVAMELIPRISRAQSMDALSAMSSIAGYRAALLAAEHLPKFFPMLMTAAGTIPPAKVFVIGAGVAGLQAIAFCRRLGATVEAFDVRPVVKEQVESLGARFVSMKLTAEEAEDASGYAKEVSTDTHLRELELIRERVAKTDAVITTAMVPGKRAPVLITRDTLRAMRPGSVVVDLAAPAGGNCESAVPGKTVVVEGVTVCAPLGLPSTLPVHASQMLSRNMVELLGLMVKDGALDFSDEIVRAAMLTRAGEVVHASVRAMTEA